jgi:hypothetical protein
MSESLRMLRRANPRSRADFERTVEAAAEAVEARIVASMRAERRAARRPARRGLARVSVAGAALAVCGAVVAFSTIGASRNGPGVENAAAAVRKAATRSAASAERSGTAVLRMTHNGEIWAETTIRWHGADLEVSRAVPPRAGRPGGQMLVVGGMMYDFTPVIGWSEMGSPDSVDPDSGTTPAEYLAAAREDVGGVTLRRVTGAMRGLTSRSLADGSTVYTGLVAARVIARETGFKGDRPIRVLPFGYVAHDEAADPDAVLRASVTVGADGIVRELAVAWGSGASTWTYAVSYSKLGATPPLVAPANAKPFVR